jgi:N-acetylglucosaminyldiphosphoundecaprenol N-acetyl-beta-D-mannosaminyltransferase
MGTPAKELWIDRHFPQLEGMVTMGVGGSFDVLSGTVARAPVWMQRMGLEWFFRFLQEPRRMWHRYFVTSFRFLFRVLAEIPRSRRGAGESV